MNNYAVLQAPSTPASNTVIVQTSLGLGLAGVLLLTQLAVGQNLGPNISPISHSYINIIEHSRTSGQYTNLFTGEYKRPALSFEEGIALFYAKLSSKQQPLGKEFEKVLHDNLWDLLVTT